MAKPIKFDESSDNEDLQSLFDSIAAGSEVPMHATKPPEPAIDASGDSDDLQALFDSVSAQVGESTTIAAQVSAGATGRALFRALATASSWRSDVTRSCPHLSWGACTSRDRS